MWHNPNWSKPPLRFVIPVVFIPLIFLIGRAQGQGQGQRIPVPQTGFPPQPLAQPPPFRPGPQQGPPPQFQQGQVPFQQGQAPFQQGRGPFQQGQVPLQQGQVPFQQGQAPFQQGRGPFQQGQPQQFQMLQQLPSGFSNGSSFDDPRKPQAPVQLTSIVDLGPQRNMHGLSMFRSWKIMSDFLSATHSPDYILSLQPELYKGIPSFNMSLALGEPSNPQVLKALVTHSTGMLVSQQSLIVGKLLSRLGEPGVIHMILGTENPGELIAFLNPRLVRKLMPEFIRAIGEFTSMRSEPNILKVRLLPTNFLSIMLTTLLGNNPLTIQTLSSRTFGNGNLISSSLMGINCQQFQNIPHDQVVPILEVFRNQLVGMRKVVKNLNYPINFRNCSLEAVLGHLDMKDGNNDTNLLSRLEGREIEAIGGELFTGAPIQALESSPVDVRQQILIEIGQLEMFELLFLAPVSTLQWFGRTLLVDLATTGPMTTTGPPQPLASASSPGSLDTQSLLKLGNLFCYTNILNANASSESIRQFLTTKMAAGAKTCCLDPMGQLEWSTVLKKTFGSDPSKWKSEELGLIGDLLVALSGDDIAKIPVNEIGKIISGVLQKSGLNFPVQLQRIHGAMPFAEACSELLDDRRGWLDSFKALMRKYALGAQLMVDSMQGGQKVMDNNRNNNNNNPNSGRFVRETEEWNAYVDRHYNHFRRSYMIEDITDSHHQEQRYRRQAPPTVMVLPPPLVAANRAPPPAQVQPMRPVVMALQPNPMRVGTPPQQPIQRLPPTAASQRMRPIQPPPLAQPQPLRVTPPVPQQRIPQPLSVQQAPIQAQRQPQLMAPIPGSQGQALSQRQPIPPPTLAIPLNSQQQGPIRTPGPPPAPTVANVTGDVKLTDERTRALSSDPEVKLTCLGIKAAGPAAIGLEITDFNTLERDDLMSCIESIGLVDWGDDMQRELLLLYKHKLNLTSRIFSALNLIELGSLVRAFSTTGQASTVNGLFGSNDTVQGHDKFKPFDISSIDLRVPENLDSVAILGTGIRNTEMLKVIGEKFSQDNRLFKPREGNSRQGRVRNTVWALGNIICGLDQVVLKTIFDTSPSLFLDVSTMLGRLQGCDPETLSILAHYAIQPTNYGDPKTWTPEDVNTLGVILAGLTHEARESIPPLSMEAFHPLATAALSKFQARSTPAMAEPPQNLDDGGDEEMLAEPPNDSNSTVPVIVLVEEERDVNGTITPRKPIGNGTTTSSTNTTKLNPSTTNVTHPEGVKQSGNDVAGDAHPDAESSAEKNLVKSMSFLFPIVILVVMTVCHR